uniref:Uncharacterized protein n=1 Tax=Acrobeloides nanus TaxID=290746 RepID=A0A914E1W6_9BILA
MLINSNFIDDTAKNVLKEAITNPQLLDVNLVHYNSGTGQSSAQISPQLGPSWAGQNEADQRPGSSWAGQAEANQRSGPSWADA